MKVLVYNDMIFGFGGVLLCCISDILKWLFLGIINVVMFYLFIVFLEKLVL